MTLTQTDKLPTHLTTHSTRQTSPTKPTHPSRNIRPPSAQSPRWRSTTQHIAALCAEFACRQLSSAAKGQLEKCFPPAAAGCLGNVWYILNTFWRRKPFREEHQPKMLCYRSPGAGGSGVLHIIVVNVYAPRLELSTYRS